MSDGVCSVDGCERKVAARGWCINHYRRWWRRGGNPAEKLPSGPKAGATHSDDFGAECWCQAEIVQVTPEEVRAGETRSCGRPGCDRDAMEATTPHPRGARR